MMRLVLIALVGCCLGAGPATPPPTPPTTPTPPTPPAARPRATTRPTAARPPRVRDALENGSVRFLVPADWKLVERTDDGLRVRYDLPDGRGFVSMQVAVQQQALPARDEGVRKRLAEVVLRSVAQNLTERNVEMVDPPRVEYEEPFMAKIHERFREGGTFSDAVHAYRGVGIFLVNVLAVSTSEDRQEAKAVHEAGTFMLMSVTTGPKDLKLVRPLPKD